MGVIRMFKKIAGIVFISLFFLLVLASISLLFFNQVIKIGGVEKAVADYSLCFRAFLGPLEGQKTGEGIYRFF